MAGGEVGGGVGAVVQGSINYCGVSLPRKVLVLYDEIRVVIIIMMFSKKI